VVRSIGPMRGFVATGGILLDVGRRVEGRACARAGADLPSRRAERMRLAGDRQVAGLSASTGAPPRPISLPSGSR
jgi:hypothetical protein